jgi:hypothetical protein
MTTRNLVPRLSGEGKLGISSKPWAEVNATAAAFTTLNISNLKNASGQDLLVAGTGVSLSSSGSQISIGLTTAFLDDLGFDTTSGLNSGFTRNNGDALNTDDSFESGDSIKVAIQKLNDDLRGVAVPTIVFSNLAPALVVNTSEGIGSNDNDTTLPTSGAVKSYVDTQLTGSDLDFQGDSGGALSIDLDSEVLDIAGGTGISTSGSGNTLTVNLDNTSVAAGDYGSATAIPVLAIDAQGRITSAQTASVATTLTFQTDGGVDNDVALITDRLKVLGGDGILTSNDGDDITIALKDLDTPPTGSFGSATAVPVLAIDAKGRVVTASSTNISLNKSAISGFDESVEDILGASLAFSNNGSSNTGITFTYNDSVGQITADVSLSGFEIGALSDVDTTDVVSGKILKYNGSSFVVADETDTNTQLTDEQVQDIVGAQIATNGSHTGIDVAYDDDNDGAIDLSISNEAITASKLSKTVISAQSLTLASNLVDGDEFLVSDTSETTNKLKKISASTIKTYMQGTFSTSDVDVSVANLETRLGDIDSDVQIGTDSSVQVTIPGNLVVTGTTTTSNVETVSTSNGVVFEGSVSDGNDLTLLAAGVTGTRTITLPDLDGHVPVLSVAATEKITSTPTELNLLGGSSAGSIVDGRAVIYSSSGGNIAATTFTGDLIGDVTGTVSSLTNHDADSLSEKSSSPTNKYFTDARARASISVLNTSGGDGSLAYNQSSGEITYTGPSASEVRGHFSNGTGVTITDGVLAIGQSVGTSDNVVFSQVNAALVGNASSATALVAGQDISITSGPVTTNVIEFDGTGVVALVSSIANNAITNNMIANEFITISDGINTTPVTLGGTLTIQGTSNEIEVAENAGTVIIGLPDTITAALDGNASSATALATGQDISITSGPVTTNVIEFDGTESVALVSSIANGAILHAMIADAIPNSKLANISAENKVSAISLDVENASNYATTGAEVLHINDKILVHDTSVSSTKNKAATLSQLITFLESESTFNGSTNIDTLGTISTGTWNGSIIANGFVADALTISGGTINNTPIGASTTSTGKFTTLEATTSLKLASGATITGVNDTDSMSDASATTIATSESIKAYVDAQDTAQALSVQADSGDSRAIILGIDVLDIAGGNGISTNTDEDDQVTIEIDSTVATLTDTQTLTSKTLTTPLLTTPKLNDTSSDHTYDVKVSELTADREITLPLLTGNDTFVFEAHPQTLTNKTIDFNGTGNTITNVEVHNFADAAIILKEQSSNGEGIASNDSDTALPTSAAVKQYVDDQLGRFGGIFKTHEVTAATFNESNELTSAGEYDVQFDSSPLVRSHFGPFAFDLGQLVSSGGSDITFFGATATGASDRHFLVIGSDAGSDTKGDCKFTGADHTTP